MTGHALAPRGIPAKAAAGNPAPDSADSVLVGPAPGRPARRATWRPLVPDGSRPCCSRAATRLLQPSARRRRATAASKRRPGASATSRLVSPAHADDGGRPLASRVRSRLAWRDRGRTRTLRRKLAGWLVGVRLICACDSSSRKGGGRPAPDEAKAKMLVVIVGLGLGLCNHCSGKRQAKWAGRAPLNEGGHHQHNSEDYGLTFG